MAGTFNREAYYQLAHFLCHAKLTEYGLHTPEQNTLAIESLPLDVAPELYQLLIALSTHDLNSARFAFSRKPDGRLTLKVTLQNGKQASTTLSCKLTAALLGAMPDHSNRISTNVLPIPALLKQIEQQLARKLPDHRSFISAKIEQMHPDESFDLQLTVQPDARGQQQPLEQMKHQLLDTLRLIDNDTNATIHKNTGFIDILIRGVKDLTAWYQALAEQIEASLAHPRQPGLDSAT